MEDEGISLRPVVLKPGGGGLAPSNPFKQFGAGAGFGIKAKKATTAAPVEDDTVEPKKEWERIKYSKDFLMQFMEGNTRCPLELQQLGLPEIVISEDSERDQQRQVLQKVAEDIDDRDWRARDEAAPDGSARPDQWERPAAAPVAAAPPQERTKLQMAPPSNPPAAAAAAPSAPAAAPRPDQEPPKVIKAADVGLQAYRPGAALSNEERALRTIKGILNKLTPEKFERLLQQLLEVITTADILRNTITLVFENAVEQPTYCAMYADLCLKLANELPSFPPPAGSDKPVAFRQILLNTCQDEFEGAENLRQQLANQPDAESREEVERAVKKRVMGNMRLISELYKLDMVKDWIMTTCIEELLSAPKGKLPPEDNIEAACEMITTAGGRLSKSEKVETRRKLEDVMKVLEKLSGEKALASRIRFIIKDVLDLRRSNWVPRREVFTAKKLDEVRAQAEAELGMISSNIAATLPTLPAQQRMGPGMAGDVPLIPPLRSEAEGWGLFPPLRSSGGANGTKSALIGDWQPTPAGPTTSAPAPGAQPATKAAEPVQGGGLSEEELQRKTDSLLDEYLSTLDKKEALECVRELKSPQFMSKLVEKALDKVLNSVKEQAQTALFELLLFLHQQGAVSSTDLISGLATYTLQLEDLRMDFPKANQQLSQFLGMCINANVLGLDVVPQLLEGDIGAEVKRDYAGSALRTVRKALGSDEKMTAACNAAGLKAKSFLEATPEDGEMPSVEAFLQSQGLSSVPL